MTSNFFFTIASWFTENVQVKPKFNTQYHPRNPPSPTKNLKPWTPFNPDATLWVSGWKAREEVERKELKMVLNELKTVIFYFMTTAGRQSCWHVNCLSQPFVSIFKKNATVNSQESKKTKFVVSAKEIEDQQLHNSYQFSDHNSKFCLFICQV